MLGSHTIPARGQSAPPSPQLPGLSLILCTTAEVPELAGPWREGGRVLADFQCRRRGWAEPGVSRAAIKAMIRRIGHQR